MRPQGGPQNRWRLDRTVTLGVVLTLAAQTAGALLWAGAASARLDQLEARAEAGATVNERLARLEEQIAQSRASLDRIERRLDERRE
ncbi:MAG: hypothetical protein KIS81_09485 [Maricaulaceae bacterium]|nr:hypothetical protein [Maricaulaceae bacterium]